MEIKFSKKNDLHTIETDNIKIEFSNPSIQATDEYGYLKNENDILYYYYDVKGFIKNNMKWKNIFDIKTYDFPNIICFKNMLKYFIENKISIENYQKDEIIRHGTRYTYYSDTAPLADDMYSLLHILIKDYDGEITSSTYTITIGKPVSGISQECASLSLIDISINNLKTIYECINSFIEYTIEKSNEEIKERNKKMLNSWKIEDKKLYELDKNNNVHNVFVPGDHIESVIILKDSIESKTYHSNEIKSTLIKEIDENKIVFEGGYIKSKTQCIQKINTTTIELNTLLEVFNEVEEKLNYNEDEITKDFIEILSDKEKEEFRISTEEFLYKKWKEAIINRTWMCREEHNLPIRITNIMNHENVYASVKVIIQKIKETV